MITQKLKLIAIIIIALSIVTACGVAPVTTEIENVSTLRGSGYGVAFGPAKFKVENIDGLVCEGNFQASLSSSGELLCSDGSSGKFIINNGGGDYWIGEGRMNDGKDFKVYVNVAPEALENN